MKRKIPVKPLYILYVLFVFFSCSQYNEYRVQEWQNAFFLNDSTLGVIGWDYDLDESTNALVLSDYKNVKQIYYEYNLNTEELEKIFTLSSIEIIPVYYFYTSFLFPWLFYSTELEEGRAVQKALMPEGGIFFMISDLKSRITTLVHLWSYGKPR